MPVRRGRRPLFPVNVWPPFVDAVTLVLAAFVLVTVVALVAQRALLGRLRARDAEVGQILAEKARIERRLRALAPRGVIDIDEGKVILQGEVLFDSASDQLKADGRALVEKMGAELGGLIKAEPDQMVLIGGHTDDRALHPGGRFESNWELSAARALSVSRALIEAGVPAARIVAAGFGEQHPRADNGEEAGRRLNRRIEVLLVPIKTVSSR